MEVSVEALEGLERRMTVQIPNERIDTEVKKRLEEMTRKARIDGFLCATTITTIDYLLTQSLPTSKARDALHKLITLPKESQQPDLLFCLSKVRDSVWTQKPALPFVAPIVGVII